MSSKQTGDANFTTKTSPKKEPALMELFIDCIKDTYWAENHLVKALPKMQSSATSADLGKAIASHLEETKVHVTHLEQIFELLGEKALAKKCDAMEGLSKEAEGIVESTEAGTATRDVGIILASQKVLSTQKMKGRFLKNVRRQAVFSAWALSSDHLLGWSWAATS